MRRFLEKSRYRKPIYIITGLKIVRGAKAKTLKASYLGGSLAADVDGTVWSGGSMPLSGGAEISGSMSRKQGTSWEDSSDFVLAYRLRQVKVRKAGAIIIDEDYTKGAVLGRLEHDVADAGAPELDVLVEEPDVSPDAADDFVAEEVLDGEEPVMCAVPVVSTLDT